LTDGNRLGGGRRFTDNAAGMPTRGAARSRRRRGALVRGRGTPATTARLLGRRRAAVRDGFVGDLRRVLGGLAAVTPPPGGAARRSRVPVRGTTVGGRAMSTGRHEGNYLSGGRRLRVRAALRRRLPGD
jgi:hypothetical protein